jgi:hypothetical protein
MNTRFNSVPPNSKFKVEGTEEVYYRDYDGVYYNEDYDRIIHPALKGSNPVVVLCPVAQVRADKLDCDNEDHQIVVYNKRLYRLYNIDEDDSVDTAQLITMDDDQNEVSISRNTFVSYFLEQAMSYSKHAVNSPATAGPVFDTNDFFRQVDRCVYDFRSGNLGVKKTDGKGFSVFAPSEKAGGKPSVKVCELKEFGQGIPAIAMRSTIDKLKQGDMVIVKDNGGAENWLYFLSAEKEGDTTNIEINGIEVDTGKKVGIAVQDGMLLSGDAVLVVKNFLGDKKAMKSMLPFLLMGQNGGGNNNALMMMMMLGDGDGDMKSMLPLMLMSQGQNGGTTGAPMDQNMLMMMMLMGDGDKDMKKMLPFMLMGQGGGAGGINPLVLMMLMDDKEKCPATAAPAK